MTVSSVRNKSNDELFSASVFARTSRRTYVVSGKRKDTELYAPMYVHSFAASGQAERLRQAQAATGYTRYEDIPNVPDRLRWCRHSMGLRQKDVAELVGIPTGHYKVMEGEGYRTCDILVMEALAELYCIPVYDLLDDYERFIYHDPGQAIRDYRHYLGMTQSAFAAHLNVPLRTITAWEAGKRMVTRKTWAKHFRGM